MRPSRAEARQESRGRAEAEAKIMRPSRGRGRKFEAEPSQGSWVTEAKPRRDRLENCLEAAWSRDSCLEDYISVVRYAHLRLNISFGILGAYTVVISLVKSQNFKHICTDLWLLVSKYELYKAC